MKINIHLGRSLISKIRILLFFSIFLISGCANLITEDSANLNRLSAPKKVSHTKQIESIKRSETKAQAFILVDEKFSIVKEPDVGFTLDQIKSVLEECVAFLIGEFGDPVFNGHISINVITGTKQHAQMNWKSTDLTSRKVVFQEFHLYKQEKRIIVHELTHALYQSTHFIEFAPDFALEGWAKYAEQKYVFKNKPRKALIQSLIDDYKAINCGSNFKINPDRAFKSFNDCERAKHYYAAGLVFADQNQKTILELGKADTQRNYDSFQTWADLYHFRPVQLENNFWLPEIKKKYRIRVALIDPVNFDPYKTQKKYNFKIKAEQFSEEWVAIYAEEFFLDRQDAVRWAEKQKLGTEGKDYLVNEIQLKS